MPTNRFPLPISQHWLSILKIAVWCVSTPTLTDSFIERALQEELDEFLFWKDKSDIGKSKFNSKFFDTLWNIRVVSWIQIFRERTYSYLNLPSFFVLAHSVSPDLIQRKPTKLAEEADRDFSAVTITTTFLIFHPLGIVWKVIPETNRTPQCLGNISLWVHMNHCKKK